ncbi:hypothetical protein Tco_0663947 [Tanacetum coccineum]
MPTEMELTLEQTQQGVSYEVSVSIEGVEELKRNVRIKGEKKEALYTLRQEPVYLLYGSAGVRMITAAGGRSYKENSRFKRKVATDLYKLYSSYISCWIESEYMSAYSFVLVTLDNTYWSLGSCWFHHVPADCWSWFLLVGFVVPTGLLMVSAALPGRYCLCIVS